MEIPQETEKRSGRLGSAIAIGFATCIAIYLLFPAVFIYADYRMVRRYPSAPAGLRTTLTVLFYPMGKLAQVSPAYGKFLVWECHLLGMNVTVGRP